MPIEWSQRTSGATDYSPQNRQLLLNELANGFIQFVQENGFTAHVNPKIEQKKRKCAVRHLPSE
jgi:hypothetical protein